MLYYAGLDVSMKETAVCILDENKKVIHESMEVTDPTQIKKALNEAGVKLEAVGLETGSISRWLALELLDMSFPVTVIDARLMSNILKVKINKNDKNDARGIAEAIRSGTYTEVYLKSDESTQLRTLLHTRHTLVSQRTKLLLTVRGHLKSEGYRPGGFSAATIEERLTPILKKVSNALQKSMLALIRIILQIEEEIVEIEQAVEQACEASEEIKLLQTVPGVGPVTACAFVMEIDDPSRFPDARTAAAYLGLTPRQYASGDTNFMGRISKHGNKQVRSLLYQAGLNILTRSKKWSKLKAWGMKIMKKRGTKKAAVAVARKLATILFQMLRKRQEFIFGEPKKKEPVYKSKKRKKACA